MSGFQTVVNQFPGFGIPGEIWNDGPYLAESFILNTTVGAAAANNIFGSGFSVLSQGIANAGNVGGAQIFAGLLINPKGSALYGDGVQPLNPSLTLPNYAQAELCTEGNVVVQLTAAAAIGNLLCYSNATGLLTTIARGANLAVGTSFAFGTVKYFTISSGTNLAVVSLNPTLPIPVLA